MPKTARILHPNPDGSGFYHVINRTVANDFLFHDAEKEEFTRLMRKTAAFTGIEILTHVVMSNHYHILLDVPSPRELSEPEILARYQANVSASQYVSVVRELARHRKAGNESAALLRLKRITDRMYNLSAFMQSLNQAMSEWFNRRYQRIGPLWAGRFTNVLVEAADHLLLAMAAYIDLNPVRAGIVNDPKDYRWSGYGEAVAGRAPARSGLTRLMAIEGCAPLWAAAAPHYRRLVFASGVETEKRHGLSRQSVLQTLAAGGELTLWELLHCRVRYFTDSLAIGSRSFVEGVFAGNRSHFGPRRKHGARPVKPGLALPGLVTLRALRRSPVC